MAAIEVREVVPGEYDVTTSEGNHRVLVPAGVGVPGVADEDVAAAAVGHLRRRGDRIPEVVDVSTLLATDPDLLQVLDALATDE